MDSNLGHLSSFLQWLFLSLSTLATEAIQCLFLKGSSFVKSTRNSGHLPFWSSSLVSIFHRRRMDRSSKTLCLGLGLGWVLRYWGLDPALCCWIIMLSPHILVLVMSTQWHCYKWALTESSVLLEGCLCCYRALCGQQQLRAHGSPARQFIGLTQSSTVSRTPLLCHSG